MVEFHKLFPTCSHAHTHVRVHTRTHTHAMNQNNDCTLLGWRWEDGKSLVSDPQPPQGGIGPGNSLLTPDCIRHSLELWELVVLSMCSYTQRYTGTLSDNIIPAASP